MVAVRAFAGLRQGEVLGLTWGDVDFEAGLLHVRAQLDRTKRRVPLKTARATRSVALMPELSAPLNRHRLASPYKRPNDLVFPKPDGYGRDHRSTARIIERVTKVAKLESVTFHTLRHSYATLLIVRLKLDVETVSRQLGPRERMVGAPRFELGTSTLRRQARAGRQGRARTGRRLGLSASRTRPHPLPRRAAACTVERIAERWGVTLIVADAIDPEHEPEPMR